MGGGERDFMTGVSMAQARCDSDSERIDLMARERDRAA